MNSIKKTAKRETTTASQKFVQMGDQETDPDKKEHYYKMALELEPKNVSALNKMGLLFYQKGDLREAIRFFDAVVDSGKVRNLYPIYFNKSIALKALKEYEAALNYISKALQYSSGNLEAQELKRELQDIVDEKYRRQAEREKQAEYAGVKSEKTYRSWNPPTISVLASMMYYKDWHAYKHRSDFEITDAQKQKIVAKLENKEFCCATCNYYTNGACRKRKRIHVDAKAICKAFQPGNR